MVERMNFSESESIILQSYRVFLNFATLCYKEGDGSLRFDIESAF